MIRRVELFHFKNHRETSVDISSPFTVIVGRNGSGKSAVLDGIEWCLFHCRGRDVRASSYHDLVNKGKPPGEVMAVNVTLLCSNDDVVQVRREYKDGKAQLYSRRFLSVRDWEADTPGSFSKISLNQLHELLTSLHIPYSNMNGIMIKQNMTSMACASPKALLFYIESIVGTNAIKEEMDNLSVRLESLSAEQNRVGREFTDTVIAKDKMRPHLQKMEALFLDSKAMHGAWGLLLQKQKLKAQQTESSLTDKIDFHFCEVKRMRLKQRSLLNERDHAETSSVSLQQRITSLKLRKRETERILRNATKEESKNKLLVDGAERNVVSLMKLIASKEKKLQAFDDKEEDLSIQLETENVKLESLKNLQLEMEQKLQQAHVEGVRRLGKSVRNCKSSCLSHFSSMKKSLTKHLDLIEDHAQTENEIKRIRTRISKSRFKQQEGDVVKEEHCDAPTASEIQEMEALETKTACEESLSKAQSECHKYKSLENETEQKIQQLSADQTRLNTLKSTHHDVHPCCSDRRVYSHYNYCKSLIKLLKIKNKNSKGQIQEHNFECGMLIDHILIRDGACSLAVKTALGGTLSTSIVVWTRPDALQISNFSNNPSTRCKQLGQRRPNVYLHIVSELMHRRSESERSSVVRDHKSIPLMDVVTSTMTGYEHVLRKKLSHWQLYLDNDFKDPNNNSTSSYLKKLLQRKLNVVNLLGQVILADGEVRSSLISVRGHQQKRGRQDDICDALISRNDELVQRLTAVSEPSSTNVGFVNYDHLEHQHRECVQKIEKLHHQLAEYSRHVSSAQLELDACQTRLQLSTEKWHFLQNETATRKNETAVARKSSSESDEEKFHKQKKMLGQQQELLLNGLSEQSCVEAEELSSHVNLLAKNYFASDVAAEEAVFFQKALCSAISRGKAATSNIKCLGKECKQIKAQRRKEIGETSSLKGQLLKKNIEVHDLSQNHLECTERIGMLIEDVFGFESVDLRLETIAVLEGRASSLKKELSKTLLMMRKIDRAVENTEKESKELASERQQCQSELVELDKRLEDRKQRASDSDGQARALHNCLEEDVFIDSSLPLLPLEEVTELLSKETMKKISTSQASRDCSKQPALDASTTDTHLDCEEMRLCSWERSLHHRFNEIIGGNSIPFPPPSPTATTATTAAAAQNDDDDDGGGAVLTLLGEFRLLLNACFQHHHCFYTTLRESILGRSQHHSLSEKRFRMLLRALDNINKNLDYIFPEIVPSGSCYLDYPRDKVCLFEEYISSYDVKKRVSQAGELQSIGGGIRPRARNGGDSVFREVQSLSGGQIAAVGVGLLMSMLQEYPTPFVIMDEIDAALDTTTSYRVGNLIRRISKKCINHQSNSSGNGSTSTQFVVVSHRADMQVWANEIAGVYMYQGFPAAVSVTLDDDIDQ